MKKKFNEAEKENLKNSLKNEWNKKIGNLDNFNKVWKIIEDSARYVFNSSHAYAMAGDSLYAAYFKAHHPYDFYEVAINHYQDKGDKNKMNDLIEEARKFYGLKLGSWRLGVDNSRVTIDRAKKLIYPSLSSIKGIDDSVASELYKVAQGISSEASFVEVLSALKTETSVNRAVRSSLIGIDYFHRYGAPMELYRQAEVFDRLFSRAAVKAADLAPYGLGLEDITPLCEKVTAKQAKGFNPVRLIEFLLHKTPKAKTTFLDRVKLQYDILGYVSLKNDAVNNGVFVVMSIVGNKRKRISLYSLKNGKEQQCNAWESSIQQLKEGDIIKVRSFKRDYKRVPKDIDGKKVYVKTDEKEYWLKGWSKCGQDTNTQIKK